MQTQIEIPYTTHIYDNDGTPVFFDQDVKLTVALFDDDWEIVAMYFDVSPTHDLCRWVDALSAGGWLQMMAAHNRKLLYRSKSLDEWVWDRADRFGELRFEETA